MGPSKAYSGTHTKLRSGCHIVWRNGYAYEAKVFQRGIHIRWV